MSLTSLIDRVNHYVGIDVSKQWLDCHLRPQSQSLHCGNDQTGFARIDRWLRSHGADPRATLICMENTGVYDDQLLAALTEAGWSCAVEKTTVLEKVTPEHHRKEDPFDAAGLAEYADRFADRLTLWSPPQESVELLRQLYGERRRLVTQQAAVKSKRTQSRQLTAASELLEQSWSEQLAFLDGQIDQIEARMHQIIADHPGLRQYYQLLKGIPGIGKVTGWLWLILFYGQARLNPKKIASRFGFAPHSSTSGSSVRGKTRSSGHGAAEMRGNLALAARSASAHYQRFRTYKHRKTQEGKTWPIVRNNLINKLIKIACAIWNSGQPYDPGHRSRFDRQKEVA